MIQHVAARLMEHVELDVSGPEPGNVLESSNGLRNDLERESKNAWTVHVQVIHGARVPTVVSCLGGLRVSRHSGPARENNEIGRAAPISAIDERTQKGRT